jgi:hypothetical protein
MSKTRDSVYDRGACDRERLQVKMGGQRVGEGSLAFL